MRRRFVYAQRPEGRTHRARQLRAWITEGLFQTAMIAQESRKMKRGLQARMPWLRKDWQHDEARVAAASAKRARKAS